jgi:hypothetical protein
MAWSAMAGGIRIAELVPGGPFEENRSELAGLF